MTPETRYARTLDGTHVAYQVHGEGPIDILVQRGWFSNLDHEWDEPVLAGVYRRLGSIGRVIRLDRRGSGLSDRFDPSVLPTIEDRIDDIRSVMTAVRAERIAFFGVGHASALFGVFAATHPELTHSLVMFSPPPTVIERPSAAQAAEDDVTVLTGWGSRELAAEWIAGGAPSRADDEALLTWWQADQQLSASPEAAIALSRLANQTSIDDVLPAIRVPTLVVWRADSWAAETARHIAQRVPAATACELPGPDTFLMAGDWQRTVTEVERFLLSVTHPQHEPDRILSILMFTDIVGSTDRAAAIGDRAWRELVERHHQIVRRELAGHRGREIDTAGDGFFAAFDGPARAIRCAQAIRAGMGELDLDLRIGLHAGECERAGHGLRGVAVHLGARIMATAAPGDILVSSTVRDLVAGSGIAFADAGRHALKGIPDPWQLYRVEAAPAAR